MKRNNYKPQCQTCAAYCQGCCALTDLPTDAAGLCIDYRCDTDNNLKATIWTES